MSRTLGSLRPNAKSVSSVAWRSQLSSSLGERRTIGEADLIICEMSSTRTWPTHLNEGDAQHRVC